MTQTGAIKRNYWVLCVLCLALFFPVGQAVAYGNVLAPSEVIEGADYFKGVNAVREGRYQDAQILFEKFLYSHPGSERTPSVQLLLGVAGLHTGRWDKAELYLEQSVILFPEIGDILLHYLYQLKYSQKQYSDALSKLQRLVISYPEVRLARQAPAQMAGCYIHIGRYDEAYFALSDFLDKNPKHRDVPMYTLLAGQALEELELVDKAVIQYSKLVRDLPVGEEAFLAKQRLDQLLYGGGEALTSPLWLDENKSWAKRLTKAGEHEKAIESYREILKFLKRNKLSHEETQEIRYELAVSLFRSRDYPACLRDFNALLSGDDFLDRRQLLFWKARTLIRLGMEHQAIPILKTLATGDADSSLTERSQYHLALAHMETSEYSQAAGAFSRYLEISNRPQERRKARWFLGWCLFRQGKGKEAIGQFDKLADGAKGRWARQVRYWTARAHLTENRKKSAVKLFEDIYDEDPSSYYGLQSYKVLKRLGASPTPPQASWTDDTAGKPPLPALDLRPRVGKAYSPALLRSTMLLELGLTEDAAEELETVLPLSEAEKRVRVEFARLLGHVQKYRGSLRLAYDQRNYLKSYKTPPGYSLMRLLFPRAYEETVHKNASGNGLPPDLVWAVMRQESRFYSRSKSYAGAIGLMQIMPQTGKRIAGELKVNNYNPRMLYNPETNIRFGSHFLGWLMKHYEGKAPYAVAAYNAGEMAVDRWVKNLQELPMEYFIEEIPYTETRDYVKQVSRNLTLYGLIYQED